MQQHRFYRVTKGGRKGRKGQTKAIRVGSRNPGAQNNKGGPGTGSIRHPV